jgi:ribose transport system substrate-binding protein
MKTSSVLSSLITFAVATSLAACGGSDASPGSSQGSSGDKKISIAMVPKLVGIDFYNQTYAGAQCAAGKLGVGITQQAPTTVDIPGQINIINNLVAKGTKGLTVAASDPKALAPTLQSASAKGVKVVTFDSGIDPQGDTALYATSNVTAAKGVSDRMSQRLGAAGGEVGLIETTPGSGTQIERSQGFNDGLKAHPELKLVATQNGAANTTTALNAATNMLTAHPDIKAIFAEDERATVGAATAVQRAGKTGKVLILGWDAAPDVLKLVKSGDVDSLVVQNPFKMGYDSVNGLVEWIKNGTAPKSVDTGATTVTKENLDSPEVQQLLTPKCS